MKLINYLLSYLTISWSGKVILAENSDTDLNEISEKQNGVKISKCCEADQIMVDSVCRLATIYKESVWEPRFKTEDGKDSRVKYFTFVTGYPDCGTTQPRGIIDLGKSEDKLNLLTDGRLQHIILHEHNKIQEEQPKYNIHEIPITIPVDEEPASYIHERKQHCMEKILMTRLNTTGEYAMVCVPVVVIDWKDTSFLLRKIINPIFHALAMILYLIVAIIYFVLPTLRDLAGNIITTINVCLIVSQAAGLVRIFTELKNHVSYMITDVILYISLLGAFFWLNSFGYYIWKTFKSRNVFLRVTDVRKYCYYSSVVWFSVVVMTAMAICAHFLLDTGTNPYQKPKTNEQETIGLLGIAIFFTPIAFTIMFNIFFFVTTLKVIQRMNIYGRIHHKLKGCFILFMQLFLIMTTAWLFMLLSWLNYDGLIYPHIVVNMLQAILIFYVCVSRQSHVTFLLRKSCCYAEPVPTGEWGDEMTQMNGGSYY